MADPSYNAVLHTTCVATLLGAGHANNALPQRATANVNCRILPGGASRNEHRPIGVTDHGRGDAAEWAFGRDGKRAGDFSRGGGDQEWLLAGGDSTVCDQRGFFSG